jgi:peptidoglycan/LPS O-acetylase OafA/YrhL
VPNKVKLAYLELFRGIAILAVLAIHTTSGTVASMQSQTSLYRLYQVVNAASHFAVPSFLFLSALVLFYHYDGRGKQNWLSFYRKRFMTIVIPYLLWSLLYSLIVVHYKQHGTLSDALLRVWKGLLVGGSYAHLYFIIIIAQFYILFPLFLKLVQIRLIRNNLVLIGALTQAAFYFMNYYYIHMNKIGTFAGSYLLFFFLGAHAAFKLKSDAAANGAGRSLGIYAAFAIACFVYVEQMWLQRANPHWIEQPWLSIVNFVSDYTYSAICCYMLLDFCSRMEASRFITTGKWLLAIGTYSFGIYFIHPLFLLAWRELVMINGHFAYHILTAIGGLTALLLSGLITAALQHSPFGVYLVGKREKRKLPPGGVAA